MLKRYYFRYVFFLLLASEPQCALIFQIKSNLLLQQKDQDGH